MTITVDPNPAIAGQPAVVTSTGHTPGEEVTLKQYDDPNLSEPLGEPDGTYTATADADGEAEFTVVVDNDVDMMGFSTAEDPGWDDVTVVHVVAGDGR